MHPQPPLRGDPASIYLPEVGILPGPARAAHAADAQFRPDIEGLRGIAVLSVLAVHAFPEWLRGGFIGVDIFFVLSGYLISGLVLRALEQGEFSVADFYARRVRRLLPALCLVLATTLAAAALLTFPNEARQIGKHVAAGAGFVSNLVYWREAGYFDASAETKPLLHLWSLAIEEQYYLVWPAVAIALFARPRQALWFIGAALALSLGLNLHFIDSKPNATFFLPLTRAWELIAGAMLAYAGARPHADAMARVFARLAGAGRNEARARDVLSIAGALLLAAALWFVDRTRPFPGAWALLPVLGTVALIAAGPRALVNRLLLGGSVLRFYGAISYPLYLWHWPLLSFPVLLNIPLDEGVRVLVLVASVGLATATWQFVEKPMRSGQLFERHIVHTLLAILALLGAAGLGLKFSDGLLHRYPEQLRELASTEWRFDFSDYRMGHCLLRLDEAPSLRLEDCLDRRRAEGRLVLLWGDSHAASLYPGLRDLLRAQAPSVRLAQITASRCPPLPKPPDNASRTCAGANEQVWRQIAKERPHTVVLAGYWLLYGRDDISLATHLGALRETVQRLLAAGVARVVVAGHLPVWTQPLPRLLLQQHARDGSVPTRMREGLDAAAGAVDGAVEHALRGTGALYVSPWRMLCGDSGCDTVSQRGNALVPLVADHSHLTREGSERVADGLQDALALR
jgi:peptidoglycan/LPS O-acetylase OafA/YrhL